MAKLGKDSAAENIPGIWAGNGTLGGGQTKGLVTVSRASDEAATIGSDCIARAQIVTTVIRRSSRPGWHGEYPPSADAARVVFREDAIANGVASFLGHQRRCGDSVYGAIREVALRDVFVTIQANAVTYSAAGCARPPARLWEASFLRSTGSLWHW